MKIEIELGEDRKLCSIVVDGAKVFDASQQAGYVTQAEMFFSTRGTTGKELEITTLF